MKKQFRIGEIVQLKSGGPRMTVEKPDVEGSVECVWFAGSRRASGLFRPETLKKPAAEKSRPTVTFVLPKKEKLPGESIKS